MTPPRQPSWSVTLVEKYIIPLMLAITLMILSGAITLWMSVRDLTSLVQQHDQQIKMLNTDMQAQKAASVTRSELLETLKRVEQQLELMMLKAKINGKIKITEE